MTVVQTNFNFFDHFLRPVTLHLEDGTQCEGVLLAGHSKPPKENQIKAWGLAIKSNELQNPETAIIVSIEIL